MRISLIELRLENTDKCIFQRRSGNAPTSPNLLSYFGGSIESDEEPQEAAFRELKEETSLDVKRMSLHHIVSLELNLVPHNKVEPLELHLFSTIVTNVHFTVYEGVGSEVYSREDALKRDDLSPTARYLLDRRNIG